MEFQLDEMVANSPEASELVSRLVKQEPSRLCVVHGRGPYEGEGVLHNCVVFGHWDRLVAYVQLAKMNLSADELRVVCETSVTGEFFESSPFCDWGGHAFYPDHILMTY